MKEVGFSWSIFLLLNAAAYILSTNLEDVTRGKKKYTSYSNSDDERDFRAKKNVYLKLASKVPRTLFL